MFSYTDPTGTNLLDVQNALTAYRQLIHAQYKQFARQPNSAFTLLEAFGELPEKVQPQLDTVPWIAFPRTASGTPEEIDANRLRFQDEYVEWRTEKQSTGKVTRITFTAEFPEYYEALAQIGTVQLIEGIKAMIPGATPTISELFGPNFRPEAATPEARAAQLINHASSNPWNNGEKGILFLMQQFNTMGALFNLVGNCAISNPDILSSAVCANVGGACGPERNSDPRICEAVQNLARSARGLSLADPVGIKIQALEGIWKINGQQVDINDPTQNNGAWIVNRNGRRATLDVTKGVTIGDDPITTGTQVSTKLQVGATVISASESDLPPWARTGQESSRRIV